MTIGPAQLLVLGFPNPEAHGEIAAEFDRLKKNGFGLFSGPVWARTVGVIIALVSGITVFVWLLAYPVWGVIMIAVDIAVIWALTAHGRDITKV